MHVHNSHFSDQESQESESESTLQPEYKSFKKNKAELARILAGNPEQITQVANDLHSDDIIPDGTYDAAINHHLNSMHRASHLLNSVLITLQTNSNQKKLFDKICTSLERSGIVQTTLRHDAGKSFYFYTLKFTLIIC